MKNKIIALCALGALCVAYPTSARHSMPLNAGWQFAAEGQAPVRVDLPHDFQISQPWVAPSPDEKTDNSDGAANIKSRLSARAFKEMGKGTYTRTLFVPDSLRDKRVLLDFGGIMLVGDVYLNGERVGGTDYGYLGFECDITDKVRFGADNELMVVADTGGPLNSRWYTGGGLYRGVDLVTTDKDVYFNRHGLGILTPSINEQEASVAITADINAAKTDAFSVVTDIFDGDGKQVAHAVTTFDDVRKWRNREYALDTISVAYPRLWSCEEPNLYTAQVSIVRPDGSVADTLTERFGFRTIEFSPDFGLKLNGKKIYLKGIANHHTLGALGAAAYPAAIEKRLKLIKDFGFNHVRCSHNPYSEEFYDLCDEYGILVVDELYDKWLQQYAGGRRPWTELWQDDIPEWVRRDRNHPSIIMWSLGNELQGYKNLPFNDWGVTAYKLQKVLMDRYDTSRPVTVAMHPRVRSLDTDSLPAPLVHETDIAAYNYRYMYFPGDARRFPGLIFYQSEANLSNMGPNFFIPQYDNVIGLAYWGMIDYLGESLGWPAKGWTDGVFDISLNPKPNAWFLKSMFVDEPVVRIGVEEPGGRLVDWNGIKIGGDRVIESWNFNDGDKLKVFTYTNADEVALRVNGKEVGRKANPKDTPAKRNRIIWPDVPYSAGNIEAVAYNDGKEVSRHRIVTAGKAVKLVAEPDNAQWQADGLDLQHVAIKAVDKKGNVVPLVDDELTFTVEGPASLVGVSNGDMTSDESCTGNSRRLYHGRALAILRAGDNPENVTLTVTSPSYPKLKINLNMEKP